MKDYAERFYKSQAWQKTRAAYFSARQGLCEICREQGRITPGEIVHHKIVLTPDVIDNPDVTLNWSNLQLVCREHHAELHDRRKRRYKFDELGHVIPLD